MKFGKKIKFCKFAGRFLAAVAFCLLVLPLNGFAKTISEYQKSLQSAEDFTEELIDYVDDILDNGEKNAVYEREVLASIRKTVPVKEKIELEGSAIETDNSWLENELKVFEKESADWKKRRQILTGISERLAAIRQKVKLLENPPSSNRSKDEDKQKLAEILRRAEYQKPEKKEESWFQRLQRSIREWFGEKFPRPDLPDSSSSGFQSLSFGLQILLYALVLGFIAFLIYRFAPFFAERFRRREREEKGERVILGEKLGSDEDARTLFDEAENLARSGNLRAAIRKGYIALLCELSDRKIIGLAQHKTNRDYLRDVRKRDELYRNMHGLTSSFERHWYGFDDASETDWNEFKQTYFQAIKSEK